MPHDKDFRMLKDVRKSVSYLDYSDTRISRDTSPLSSSGKDYLHADPTIKSDILSEERKDEILNRMEEKIAAAQNKIATYRSLIAYGESSGVDMAVERQVLSSCEVALLSILDDRKVLIELLKKLTKCDASAWNHES